MGEASLAAYESALGPAQRKLQEMTDSHTSVSAENIILKSTVQLSQRPTTPHSGAGGGCD